MSVMTLKIRMPVDVRQKPKVKLRLRLIGEGGKSDQFYKQYQEIIFGRTCNRELGTERNYRMIPVTAHTYNLSHISTN